MGKVNIKDITMEQKAKIYDFLVDEVIELRDKDSLNLLCLGKVFEQTMCKVIDMKMEGKL